MHDCVVLWQDQGLGSRQTPETWPHSHPRLARFVALAAAAAILFAGINVFQTFGPTHLRNGGPLGSLSGASFAFDGSTSGPWTAGYILCLQGGSDPVVMESVSPASTLGIGLRFLGAFVREIPPDQSTNTGAIGTAAGFPPKTTEALKRLQGFRVTQPCDANPSHFTVAELDVGLGRAAASPGGGWTGFTVDYAVGASQYVVTWDTGLYACGPGAGPMCTPPS